MKALRIISVFLLIAVLSSCSKNNDSDSFFGTYQFTVLYTAKSNTNAGWFFDTLRWEYTGTIEKLFDDKILITYSDKDPWVRCVDPNRITPCTGRLSSECAQTCTPKYLNYTKYAVNPILYGGDSLKQFELYNSREHGFGRFFPDGKMEFIFGYYEKNYGRETTIRGKKLHN